MLLLFKELNNVISLILVWRWCWINDDNYWGRLQFVHWQNITLAHPSSNHSVGIQSYLFSSLHPTIEPIDLLLRTVLIPVWINFHIELKNHPWSVLQISLMLSLRIQALRWHLHKSCCRMQPCGSGILVPWPSPSAPPPPPLHSMGSSIPKEVGKLQALQSGKDAQSREGGRTFSKWFFAYFFVIHRLCILLIMVYGFEEIWLPEMYSFVRW